MLCLLLRRYYSISLIREQTKDTVPFTTTSEQMQKHDSWKKHDSRSVLDRFYV